MPTTVVPAPDAAALAVTLLPEVTTDSPAERAWVPAYAAPQGWRAGLAACDKGAASPAPTHPNELAVFGDSARIQARNIARFRLGVAMLAAHEGEPGKILNQTVSAGQRGELVDVALPQFDLRHPGHHRSGQAVVGDLTSRQERRGSKVSRQVSSQSPRYLGWMLLAARPHDEVMIRSLGKGAAMSDDPVRPAAGTPEALHAIIADAFNRGDVGAFLAHTRRALASSSRRAAPARTVWTRSGPPRRRSLPSGPA